MLSSIQPPGLSAHSSMDQIRGLSDQLVKNKSGFHPSDVHLSRSSAQWQLVRGWGQNCESWKKSTTKAAITGVKQPSTINRLLGKTVEATQFNKTGIKQGLIPLSEGKVTAFTEPKLQFIKQKAPPIGDTLRLAISEKGEVLIAIPNLEKGSVLAQAGVTAEDMENLTTTTAAAKLYKHKAGAINKYWAAIAAIADNPQLIAGLVGLNSNRAPFFNIALQTHYPQHLRFTFNSREHFGRGNPYFTNGIQTTLLDTLASRLNKTLFPAPLPAIMPASQPASSVATPPEATTSVAKTLGIEVSNQGLEQIKNMDTVVLPSHRKPGFKGKAGSCYISALPNDEQSLLHGLVQSLSQGQLLAFQTTGVLPIDFKTNNQSLVFVRSPQKPSNGSLKPLIQVYAGLLNQVSESKHVAVPLVSAGGNVGFTAKESIEAAVLAMNGFKDKNPGSALKMTLCNPAMDTDSLEQLLNDATDSLKKVSIGGSQRAQPEISITGLSIHQVNADAWVNPTSTGLACGGVVSKSIISALNGESLTEGLSTCEESAAVTNGKKLGAQQVVVVHVAGPSYDINNTAKSNRKLHAAYVDVIRKADQHGCKSIAIPAISTGALGFPLDKATPIAFSAVRKALRSCKHLTEVKFCYHGPQAEAIYKREFWNLTMARCRENKQAFYGLNRKPPANPS